ncbi:AroE Shikimate 5-dehydrogenase [Candidatus Nanopelagicaceae bacterium]
MRGAILGSPVEHSLSPLLHREAFEFLGISGDYIRQEVTLGGFSEFFEREKDNFDYLSITMPLKEEALALPVAIDPIAARIQSSNTLYRRGGDWHLSSTDGAGLIGALANEGHKKFARALVLGAGGTARAVVGALDGVASEIVVLGRTSTRREVLEAAVDRSDFQYLRWNDSPGFSDFDLVVNTTPAGAADLLAESISPGSCSLLFDVIYKPWPTVLASRWSDNGGSVINGAELLLYQGIAQLSLALNRELDALALATHLRPILRKAIR